MAKATRREFLLGGAGAALTACGTSQPEAPPRPPNILLFFPDQHRFDWTGLNPDIPVRTPNLNEIAARGVRFTNAVVASPLCAPSRACLAGGREYGRCNVPSNAADYPLEQTTYYQLLRDAGYHTLGCGKFDLHKATEFWQLDGKRLIDEWGFIDGIDNAGKWDAIRSGSKEPKDPYMGHLHATGRVKTHVDDFEKRQEIGTFLATFPTPLQDESYCDNWIANNGLSLLKGAPQDKPWHLVVNFAGPHEPVDITNSMVPLYDGVDFPQPNRNTQYPAEKHIEIRRNYSAMIENIDRWFGVFLDEVEKRGELDNTLVVFSSDHGEMLGDHDRWMKRQPHQPSIGVPLVVAGPGVWQGVTSDALVSVMDLAATFVDYAGGDVPEEMDSRSLRPVLEGTTETHRDILLSGFDPWRVAFDGRFKLVRGYDWVNGMKAGNDQTPYAETQDMPPALFDMQEDPLENNDIAGKAPEDVKRLTAALHGLIGLA